MDTYLSLATASEGLYREKGSKFFAFAYPVTDEAEVNIYLTNLRKQHHSARHHCYAFVLKPAEGQEERYRTSDDGEPTHSAGDPMLGQIRSHQLTDVLLVVVRYFGGTKLGIGGLINAYKTAAADAIAHNRMVEKVRTEELLIRFGYENTSEVQRIIHQYSAEVVHQEFAQQCHFCLRVAQSSWEEAKAALTGLPGVVCS